MTATLFRHLCDHWHAEQQDADLVRAYARGRDDRAFRALVQRYGPGVWRLCRRIVGDAATADDVFPLNRPLPTPRRPSRRTGKRWSS